MDTIFSSGKSSPFVSWHSLSLSSLECKALYIIFCFLVLRSIRLSSFLVAFKDGPEYLTKVTSQVFISFDEIPWLGFEKFSWSSEIFFFLFFLFISSPFCDSVRFQYSRVLLGFLFSEFSDSFLIKQFYFYRYLFFLTFHFKVAQFSMPNSLPISWLYILIVCIRVSNWKTISCRLCILRGSSFLAI